MARPKGPEETTPVHTRLTSSQHAGFREYIRRQQEQIKHTGVQLTEAAALRGMVLRCLDLENIAHSSAQQAITFTSSAPSSSAAPAAAPPAEPPADDTAPATDAAQASATPSTEAPAKGRAAKRAKAPAAKGAAPASAKGAKKEPTAPPKGKVAAKPGKRGAR